MHQAQAAHRHEILFSMSAESNARTLALLRRCGHNNLNLLLARGLALVEFVLDQVELGRSVGSVVPGEEGFLPLRERPELLAPGKRRTEVAAAGAPARSTPTYHTSNPKLIARSKTPPATTPEPAEPRVRRVFKHAAFAVNDATGPVRSLAFHREHCASKGLPAPIDFNGVALPGLLAHDHLAPMVQVMEEESMATHFQLSADTGELTYFAYFPKAGWHHLQADPKGWVPDPAVVAGAVSVFPLDQAAAYLRWQARRAQGEQKAPEA